MRDLLLCAKHLFVAAMVAWQRLKDEPVDTLDLREVRLSVPKAGLNYASFAVGVLLAVLIAVGMFILLVSQQ